MYSLSTLCFLLHIYKFILLFTDKKKKKILGDEQHLQSLTTYMMMAMQLMAQPSPISGQQASGLAQPNVYKKKLFCFCDRYYYFVSVWTSLQIWIVQEILWILGDEGHNIGLPNHKFAILHSITNQKQPHINKMQIIPKMRESFGFTRKVDLEIQR